MIHEARLSPEGQHCQAYERPVVRPCLDISILRILPPKHRYLIEQIIDSNKPIYEVLAAMAEHSLWTLKHEIRTASIAIYLARKCQGGEPFTEHVAIAGLVHDSGKRCVSRETLDHPGRLTEEMIRQIKPHPQDGADIIETAAGEETSGLDLRLIERTVALHHDCHEPNNGINYVRPIDSSELALRVVTSADTIDAVISDRPYGPGSPVERAREILNQTSGIPPDILTGALHHAYNIKNSVYEAA